MTKSFSSMEFFMGCKEQKKKQILKSENKKKLLHEYMKNVTFCWRAIAFNFKYLHMKKFFREMWEIRLYSTTADLHTFVYNSNIAM